MGAKKDGMGNICELLINVVMGNKPKMLIGLDQKVRGKVRVLNIHSTQSNNSPGGKPDPNPSH